MIVQDGVQVPCTHNIKALIKQLPESVAVPGRLPESANLTQYAVVARYPAGVATVSDEEHRRVVA
jgi:HEPN domain-containing protein